MPRVVSFFVLLAVLLLIGALFFKVMIPFVAPLFLAAVLVVVFGPLHEAIARKLPGRPRVAAGFTTFAIAFMVLLPTLWFGLRAYSETRHILAFLDDKEQRDALIEAVQHRGANLLQWYETTTGAPLDTKALLEQVARQAGTVVVNSVQAIFKLIVASAIMMLSLYYFLTDGPSMIRTLMHLSPLDDAYERELLEKFSNVSRAVVVASLLSALVQGILAGIGYYFALHSGAPIVLLMVLTMLLAIVPFVGAAAVWIPTCLFVLVYQIPGNPESVIEQPVRGDMPHAVGLAIYCLLIVSTVDNLIKPFVLHGQSNLHPLLALISVLGGVAALGPIGILVGPMLVAFGQALLTMVNKELRSMGDKEAAAQLTPKPASAITGPSP